MVQKKNKKNADITLSLKLYRGNCKKIKMQDRGVTSR